MIIPTVHTALPVVTSITECADYEKTFGAFLPQLLELPQQIASSISDPEALKAIYLSTNPAIFGLALVIASFPIFFIVSEVNGNYSQVDRVWSILPTLFNIHYNVWARLNGLPTERLNNLLAVSVLWSCRLTFNYWRRGGYKIGSEDYRWEIIGKYIGRFGFLVLNIMFISTLQIVQLWSITLPTYLLLLTSRIKEPVPTDTIIPTLFLVLIVTEWFADGQQWDYHQAKAEYHKTARVPKGWTSAQLDRGFLTAGLWKYSRHPNFAAEQSVWLLFYLWGVVETEKPWNYTVAGVIGYMLIFQGSTPITEWISATKYPEYRLYQERVGMFVPSLFSKGWDEKEIAKLGPQVVAQQKSKSKKAQ